LGEEGDDLFPVPDFSGETFRIFFEPKAKKEQEVRQNG